MRLETTVSTAIQLYNTCEKLSRRLRIFQCAAPTRSDPESARVSRFTVVTSQSSEQPYTRYCGASSRGVPHFHESIPGYGPAVRSPALKAKTSRRCQAASLPHRYRERAAQLPHSPRPSKASCETTQTRRTYKQRRRSSTTKQRRQVTDDVHTSATRPKAMAAPIHRRPTAT